MHISQALDALAAGDVDRARAIVRTGGSPLARALSQYLASDPATSVYDQPAAFEAFINGGGNIGLYRAVSEALAGIYTRTRPASLLDIGCGDGRALLPSLAAADARPAGLTLVEPSAALLDTAVRGLAEHGLTGSGLDLDARNTRVEPFVADLNTAFDVAQSTFALHTLSHEVRDQVLTALAPRVGVLAVVEFDVPDVPHAGPEHRAFLAETYERGLAEYDADRDLVAQGFLLPVLTGQLLPGARRVTWEQPAARWVEQVERAGFTNAAITPLCDYWSSPAFLLTATGQHSG